MSVYFESILPNFGFDDTINPQWLMVPHKSKNHPLWMINGADCNVISRAPSIADVTVENPTSQINQIPDRKILRISGNAVGRTFLEIRRNGQLIKLLEVSVKPPITLKISFHFVSDSANHSTKKMPEEIEPTIAVLNQIFTPQTNISFQKKNHFLLKLPGNLGDAVNWNYDYQAGRYMKGHEFDLVTSKRDRSAHINIFFVWQNEFVTKNEKGKIEKSGALGYSVGGRDILIQDWDGDPNRPDGSNNGFVWEDARMWAHELGHILGVGDVNKTKKITSPTTHQVENVVVNAHYIMGSGPFIPKHHANIMSAIAKQIAGR